MLNFDMAWLMLKTKIIGPNFEGKSLGDVILPINLTYCTAIGSWGIGNSSDQAWDNECSMSSRPEALHAKWGNSVFQFKGHLALFVVLEICQVWYDASCTGSRAGRVAPTWLVWSSCTISQTSQFSKAVTTLKYEYFGSISTNDRTLPCSFHNWVYVNIH